MRLCSNCSKILPKSKRPNKTGLCGVCYKKHNYAKWIETNDRSEYRRQYTVENRERLTANKKAKYNNDPFFRLKETIRTRIAKAVRRGTKSGSAINALGCSIEELVAHLQAKFLPGMTWDNYGKWHIDHIRPLDSFDLSSPEDFNTACHYTNLQPLWAKDNLKKGNKC